MNLITRNWMNKPWKSSHKSWSASLEQSWSIRETWEHWLRES